MDCEGLPALNLLGLDLSKTSKTIMLHIFIVGLRGIK